MINRRDFIQLSAISSLGLIVGIPKTGAAANNASELHPLIRVGIDGVITLFAQNPEMGQGVKTALPMIIAEELDVGWQNIRVEQADWDPRLENQFSGGSLSIRLNYNAMRQAGAAARSMLISAAARRLGRPETSFRTRNGFVVDTTDGRRIAYSDLASDAATLPVPDDPQLKADTDFALVGKSIPDVDVNDIISGQLEYSLDIELEDMLYAVVKRSPHGDGQPVSFEVAEAEQVPGVVGFHMLRNIDHGGRIILPNCPNFVSGVAVLANTTWAALKASKLLEVEWQLPGDGDDSDELMSRFEATLDDEPEIVREDGDPDQENPTLDVIYRLPWLAHTPMEPMNCTARVSDDTAIVWAPTQNPPMAAEAVAKILEIPQENVTIHVVRSGGAFGRRFYADFIMDTVLLAREYGRPVKVVWPREDDVRHDYFRPASVQRVRASISNKGDITHWQHKVVSYPREHYLERDGSGAEIGNYEFPAAFVPNLRYEYNAVAARVPTGQWRAVEHSSNVFVVSSVIDELAHAAGKDAVQFWLQLIGDQQFVQVRDDFRFDAGRLARVVRTAAENSGWGSKLPPGRGRGIAASYNQGAWVAEVAEVSVENKRLTVHRMTCAIDCGLVINPSGALQQVEGGILEGISAALFGNITLRDGIVQQSNFHDYPLLRMSQAPGIDVEFIASDDAPRGLGEAPLPPAAPAITNAIFAATGKRIRELPIRL